MRDWLSFAPFVVGMAVKEDAKETEAAHQAVARMSR